MTVREKVLAELSGVRLSASGKDEVIDQLALALERRSAALRRIIEAHECHAVLEVHHGRIEAVAPCYDDCPVAIATQEIGK